MKCPHFKVNDLRRLTAVGSKNGRCDNGLNRKGSIMGPTFPPPANSQLRLINVPRPTYNYIIAYDLNFPGRDYHRLRQAIVQSSHWYASLQKSLFFINTEISTRQDLYRILR